MKPSLDLERVMQQVDFETDRMLVSRSLEFLIRSGVTSHISTDSTWMQHLFRSTFETRLHVEKK